MINPERAKLIPVSGNNDNPDLSKAVDVQFNPTTLKVSLSNTLKENQRAGNSRSSQFVDKSSSSLTVELIFDTTYIDDEAAKKYKKRAQNEGRERNAFEVGTDVRLITKRIGDKFIKPVPSGNRLKAPSRCLFQWGAFEFLGLVESFDETLDFFSPEGHPLRATVSLKLSEDRYQFRNRTVAKATRETPTLSSTGNNSSNKGGGSKSSQETSPVPGGSGDKRGNWRDTSMYNGVENPRLPSAAMLAIPKVSASASVKVNAGLSGGFSATADVSSSLSASVGMGALVQPSISASFTPPAFKFGASGSLGTGIEGAFSTGPAGVGLTASSIANGSLLLRNESSVSPLKLKSQLSMDQTGSGKINLNAKASVGFD
ncbi:MAG TPA: hypothetical protein ENJ13_10395 [Chromatiales bacterium]|nr:hypothetical protein [Chromatiales bacterium]